MANVGSCRSVRFHTRQCLKYSGYFPFLGKGDDFILSYHLL